MNDHEAERIACSIHALRPDWPTASLLTLIKSKLIDRPRRDVTVALAWVACDSTTATPARVLENGPWWQAAAVEGATVVTARKFDRATCCGTCSMPEADCRKRWADDHDFVPAAEVLQRKADVDVPRTVAALRSELAPVAPPTEPTFTALTDRRPELAERVERIKATNPGVRGDAAMRQAATGVAS